jgi:hypothetical protein
VAFAPVSAAYFTRHTFSQVRIIAKPAFVRILLAQWLEKNTPAKPDRAKKAHFLFHF